MLSEAEFIEGNCTWIILSNVWRSIEKEEEEEKEEKEEEKEEERNHAHTYTHK